MALFALADLHLGQAVDKPMDVFGTPWQNHPEKIQTAWRASVQASDTVLIPGDISWAMHLTEAVPDLDWIANLPGHKVLLRGNHDYWWSSIRKVRSSLQPTVRALQNDALETQGWALAGSRGWLLPSHPRFGESDQTIYLREVERLKMSLQAATKLHLPVLVMTHYPPTDQTGADTGFTDLFKTYSVKLCVYGHLHGPSSRFAFEGVKDGVEYRLVSSDFVNFAPQRLPDAPGLCTIA